MPAACMHYMHASCMQFGPFACMCMHTWRGCMHEKKMHACIKKGECMHALLTFQAGQDHCMHENGVHACMHDTWLYKC